MSQEPNIDATLWEKCTQDGNAAYKQGNFSEAERLLGQALTESQKFGPMHDRVARSLNNLAELYRKQGKYLPAKSMLKRALQIREKSLGANHPDVAKALNNLAGLLQAEGKFSAAEPMFKR